MALAPGKTFRWNPGCLCCPQKGCAIFQDDFNRADGAPGSGWDNSTNFEILNNQLFANSPGVILSTTEADDEFHSIAVNFFTDGSDAEFIAHVNRTAGGDSISGHFAVQSGVGTLHLKRNGTILQSVGSIQDPSLPPPADPILWTMRVCLDQGEFGGVNLYRIWAGDPISNPTYRLRRPAAKNAGGKKFGLELAGSGAVGTFDDFTCQITSPLCIFCYPGICRLCAFDTPLAYDVTFDGVVNDDCSGCPPFNTTTFRLEHSGANIGTFGFEFCEWTGPVQICDYTEMVWTIEKFQPFGFDPYRGHLQIRNTVTGETQRGWSTEAGDRNAIICNQVFHIPRGFNGGSGNPGWQVNPALPGDCKFSGSGGGTGAAATITPVAF